MEAIAVRSLRAIFLTAILAWPLQSQAASSARTQNFIVSAPTKALATEIANEAERFRKELAISWLGQELPPWAEPCPIRAKVDSRLGAGGATSFLFETEQRQFARPVGDGLFQAKPAGRPFGWEMTVQGSRERVLDSVLPHEVTHTVFATHFGRPLPRWADEGACTTVEHESEKAKQHRMLYEFLTNERGIPFNRMFAMTEYPADILPLYSQGFSLARYLIQQGGRQKFIRYIGDGLDSNDWTGTTSQHYGFNSLSDLQVTWLDWVRSGGLDIPNRESSSPTLIAANAPHPNATTRDSGRTLIPSARPVERVATSNRSSSGGGWYAQQKFAQKSADVVEGGSPTRPGAHARVATRPNRVEQQREVLLEWGRPSPILNPTLPPRRSGYIPIGMR